MIFPCFFTVRFYPRYLCTAAGCVSPPFLFVSLFDILMLNHGVFEAKNCHLDLFVCVLDPGAFFGHRPSSPYPALPPGCISVVFSFLVFCHHLLAVKILISKMMGFPPRFDELEAFAALSVSSGLDLLPPCPALSGVSS